MNFFGLHIGDYDQATAHLSATEDGIYGRLIRWYYSNEKPLPKELAQLQRIARAITPEESKAVKAVVAEFFLMTEGGYRHSRCDEEIAAFHEKQAKASRSANARWNGANRTSETDANAMRTHMPTHSERISERNASHKPLTIKEEIPPPPGIPPAPNDPPAPAAEPRASRSAETAQGTRLPEDWAPDEAGWQYAITHLGSRQRAEHEFGVFRRHWLTKPGKDGRKLRWDMTWETWVLRAANETSSRGRTGGSHRHSLIERVNPDAADWFDRQCELAAREELLDPHGGNVRPEVDESGRREADGTVVEGSFRAVG